MAGRHNIYYGLDYGLTPDCRDSSLGFSYAERFVPSTFGFPTDPRTANQLSSVSQKLNTGAKAIEVSGITPQVLESIPNQHLDEINRLKKLVGAELTFHGPILEPTGITRRGWDPTDREQVERQMWSAVERAHRLEPKGNINVTFHSSAQLPEPETRIKIYDKERGKYVEKTTEILVIDERRGEIDNVKVKKDELTGEQSPEEVMEKFNTTAWTQKLSRVSFDIRQGRNAIEEAFLNFEKAAEKTGAKREDILKLYKIANTEEGRKLINISPEVKKGAEQLLHAINYGDLHIRDAFNNFRELFTEAWYAAEKNKIEEDKKRLEQFRNKISKEIKSYEGDPLKLPELAERLSEGLQVLSNLKHAPKVFTPLKEFAIEKAAETFSNLAYKAYDKFKETAPVISIENPPAGGALSRAEDLKKLIEVAREKFVDKLVNEKGLSKSSAKKEAEKLIGATWDVGHINMIRKFGYEEKDVVKETETIAPYVKHIHLSDNFGLEHTELPMGMGNVPIKKHIEKLKEEYGEKLKEIKQVVETGNWFEPFKITPFKETLTAFGSPIYPMAMGPYWNQSPTFVGGYFSGYGMNPDIHHSIYGAGFSNLPVELGGQMTGRNRLSGSPME